MRVLACFVFELRHALHPTHARNAIEHPAKLRVFRNLTLVYQDGLFRADAGCDESGGQFTCVVRQIFGILPNCDGVQIDHAIDARVFVLHCHKAFDRAKVVPKGQSARRLYAGKDTWRMGLRGHLHNAPFSLAMRSPLPYP